MPLNPVPLPDGAYADASKPFSDQDVVNLWCEYAEGEGTRSPKKLVQLPGLRPFVDLGAGPHRGIRNVEGNLYVVSDTHAYRIAVDGAATQLGTIPGRGRVWIAHNQNPSGAVRQVMFSNGPEGFIWDVASSTWTQISDDAFHGARSLIYLNQRFLGIEQQRRYFANSFLNDGLNWDSIETYQAESKPDRLVALIDFAGEVYAFNERTLEIFQNTTNPDDIANHIYFTRIASPVPVGAASPHGVCELDSRVFFIGNNGAGYYLSGYNPVRITTPAIETAWQDCDLSKASCFTYESRGHAIWYVTFPDGHTWGYDCLSSARAGRPIWHRRETIGLDRWRLNTLTAWNGQWVGGAYNSGILYQLDWAYEGMEGCDEIDRYFIPGVLHAEGKRVTLNTLRLECDTGYGTTTCEEVPAQEFHAGFISSGLLVSPPPSDLAQVYTADSMGGTFALLTEDLDFTAESNAGIGAVGSYVVIGTSGTSSTFRSTYPFATWEYVSAGATFSQLCIHAGKVVCLGLALRVSSDDGASYSAQAYTAFGAPPGGYTTVTSQDSLKSLDGKLVFGGNDGGDAALQYSTSLSAFTVVKVAVGENCNIPTFDYTGTHWIAATALGQIYRASSIDGPWTMVMDTGDLIASGYYPQVTAHNDSGLVLMAWAHADTTQKLLVSTDHGATWADESATFPGWTGGAISVIDNVFYTGWDKTTDGVTWTAKSLSGTDEFARFDGVVAYGP